MTDLIAVNEHIAINRAFKMRELNDVLVKSLQRTSESKQKKSFAPSSLGYNGSCPRRWYYAFNGATFEYTEDPLAINNMDSGRDAGKRIADIFDKAGILVDAERPVEYYDPPIYGFIDAVVDWQGEELIVEVKTTSDRNWNARMNSNSVPGYQMIQLLIYMHVTEHNKGFFVTENKDNHKWYVLPVKMNAERKEFVDYTLNWMRTTKDAADTGDLPTRPFNKSSMQCKGCDVRTTCWEGWARGAVNGSDPNPGVVELPVLDIPKSL